MGLMKPDKDKKLVFGKKVTYKGKKYSTGDTIPYVQNLSKHFIEKMYRNGFFKHKKGEEGTGTVERETVESSVTVTEEENGVRIVEDTEESFKVEYNGEVREIKRNQVREDGTLTKGGLKAFED